MKRKYNEPPKVEEPKPEPPKPEEPKEETKKEEKEEKRGLPGNGGTTDKYTWTQTLEDLQVYIPVHKDLKTKDLRLGLILSIALWD